MKVLTALLFALSLAAPTLASEEEKAPAPQVIYYSLSPALVGNFGTGPKLKFYKADVALRLSSPEAQAKVVHHEPLIRNQLVMLFAQQTEEGLSAPDAKEKLRQEALQQVQQVLVQEEGEGLVEDLLFNNLILQR